MKKRGQLLGTPLIMIFAIIVGALILIWGGKLVYDLLDTGQKVQVEVFIEDLEKDIGKQYNYDIGSQQEYKVKLPDKARQICFYDKEESINERVDDELKNLFKFDLSDNVFLLPFKEFENSRFKIAKIKVQEKNPLCLTNGETYVLVTGADFVEIK